MTPPPQHLEDDTCRRLCERIVLSIAIEESLMSALSKAAEDFRGDGDEVEARRLTDLVRSHRVGLIERRAVLGAAGIEI